MACLSPAPRPGRWPYRADPPNRYWGAYDVYQARGGQVRLEDDIRGFLAGNVNDGDISRFYFFCLAFDQLTKEGIAGDVAELGAYKGNTATLLATMARRMGATAWILDTFEGFDTADLTGPDTVHPVQFRDTSLEAVRALVGEENVRYVKGHFPESASQLPDDRRFALVHVDCDLYRPISHALRYFYPRLLPGGYLIVHDYASLAWEGAERAVDEFFADKAEAVIPLPDGAGSVAIRKARGAGPGNNWRLNKCRALLTDQWTGAGDGALAELLASGWSGPEDWGVWGVGPSHVLKLYFPGTPDEDAVLHVRAAAALGENHPERRIGVFVRRRLVATWDFSPKANHGERSLAITPDLVSHGPEGTTAEVEFRPDVVLPASALSPGERDDRTLGLALKGIRLGRAGD